MADLGPLDIDSVIRDPQAYELAIQHLFDKRRAQNRVFQPVYGDVNIFGIALHRRSLATRLARSVARGDYRCSPVDMWMLERGQSIRPAHRAILPDQLIGSVIAKVLSNNARCLGLPGVYSYQPGISNYSAMSDLAAYVRNHRGQAKTHDGQALYVIQSDFTKYGENLPVHDAAHVWDELRRVVDLGTKGGASAIAWNLVRALVRPVVRDMEGACFTRLYGIPMGTPVVATVSNIAIKPIDNALLELGGGFYARFNDDFLFAHPDREIVLRADASVDSMLQPLGVARKPEKTKRSLLNAAGRPCAEDASFRGIASVQFLGLTVSATGTIAPSRQRVARLLSFICKRLDQVAMNLDGLSVEERARRLARVTSALLDPSRDFAPASTGALLRDTTDRSLLKDLDFRIARKIAQLATGKPGNRGFRQVPYADLRRRWGLVSLVRNRNLR